jgi:tetratricopeptide (TPR) repeat protein
LIAALSLECATVLRQTHWVGQRMEDAARQALSIGISLSDPAMIGYALTALAEVAAVRPDFALFRETKREFLRLELCMADGLDTKFMLAAGRELRPLPDGVDRSVLQCLSAVDGITLDDDAALLQLAEVALGRSARRGRSSSARASTIWQFIGLEMFWRGRFAGIDRILERAIESAKPDDPTYVGWRQNLLAKTWLAFSAAQLGRFDMGRVLAKQCIEEADQIAEVSHLLLALNAHNVFCFYCDDASAVRECAARLEEVSFRYGIAWYQPAALLARAWAQARAGESEAARAFWERGRAMLACGIFEQIHVSLPHLLAVAAHVAAAIGQPDEALIDIDRGLALVAQTGEAHSESELYRAKGEIVLGMGDSISGERNLRIARALAQRQSAKGLELRAAISLARLLLQQRRSDEAYDILTPVHDWYQEGFDEPIMRQVQSLRDALDRARGARLPPTVLAASA